MICLSLRLWDPTAAFITICPFVMTLSLFVCWIRTYRRSFLSPTLLSLRWIHQDTALIFSTPTWQISASPYLTPFITHLLQAIYKQAVKPLTKTPSILEQICRMQQHVCDKCRNQLRTSLQKWIACSFFSKAINLNWYKQVIKQSQRRDEDVKKKKKNWLPIDVFICYGLLFFGCVENSF